MFGLDLFKAKDSANANTNANTGDSNSLTMEQPSSPQAPSNRWIVSEQRVLHLLIYFFWLSVNMNSPPQNRCSCAVAARAAFAAACTTLRSLT